MISKEDAIKSSTDSRYADQVRILPVNSFEFLPDTEHVGARSRRLLFEVTTRSRLCTVQCLEKKRRPR